jgi:Rrf2 family protein
LTRKTDYALAALAELASEDCPQLSARTLSERLVVPLRLLTNLLNQLTHSGLIASSRGTNGGYRLARRPEEITLAALIEAVEGPLRLTRCCPGDVESQEPGCPRQDFCQLSEQIQKINSSFAHLLDQVTLRDLASNNVSLSLANAARAALGGNGKNGQQGGVSFVMLPAEGI